MSLRANGRHVRPACEQGADRLGAAQVRGEVERGETVRGPAARLRRIGRENLAQAIGIAQGRDVEDVQRGSLADQAGRGGAITAVQRLPDR